MRTGLTAEAEAEGRSRAPRAYARIDIYEDVRAAREAWTDLEASAAHSPYQRQDWILPWLGTIGRAHGLKPAIVVARDAAGRPVALLPLGVKETGPFRIAGFLGGKDANFALGLYRDAEAFDASEITRLLLDGGRAAGIDLIALMNQPFAWQGVRNPLADLRRQPSPSHGYKAEIAGDGEAYLRQRLSRDTRKKLRRKEEKLAERGPLRHVVASDSATARTILAAFTEQKSRRMKEKGIENTFGDAPTKAFLERVCVEWLDRGKPPPVELHALFCGERIVATFAGAQAQGRFCGMFNAFDTDSEIARCSPGDLLLSKIIVAKGREGCATLDLGVGEARYKSIFCDETEHLFDAFVAMTPAGRVLQVLKSTKRHAKRRIKESPALWRLVERMRRLRA